MMSSSRVTLGTVIAACDTAGLAGYLPSVGERNWTGSNWEVDGKPVTYRVTWQSYDDGETHVKDFADVDDGYEYYQWRSKGARGYNVTWEHIDPS